MNTGKSNQPGAKVRERARQKNSHSHKKRRKKNYTLHYILVLFLIIVTGITLSVTVFFNTAKIEVTGSETYTPEQIAGFAQVSTGDNLFRMNLTKIEKNILKNTVDIDEVKIKRKLPDTLSITLVPSKAEAAIESKGEYYIISSGGRIIGKAAGLEEYPGLLSITGVDVSSLKPGDFVFDMEDYQTIQIIFESLSENSFDKITGMSLNSETDMKIYYDNRITLQLGGIQQLDYKLQLAKQVLSEKIGEMEQGTLDLSTEGEVRFLPKTM